MGSCLRFKSDVTHAAAEAMRPAGPRVSKPGLLGRLPTDGVSHRADPNNLFSRTIAVMGKLDGKAMKTMLLIAHGSRKESANEEIKRLAERISAHGNGAFNAVVPAFLEIAQPDIHASVDRCVELGADEIVAVPYFLAAGKHVVRDIPAELSCVSAKYPDLKITVAPHIGEIDAMVELVVHTAEMAG